MFSAVKFAGLCALAITAACTHSTVPGSPGSVTLDKPAESTIITVQVTFAATPVSASVAFASLKYNKQATFQFDVDDNSTVILDPYVLCMGGTASDGVTYPGKTFTDGCGNPVNWRGSLALNAHGNYNNNDTWLLPSRMSAAQVATLVKTNWSILNHGYYHDPTGNFTIGATATASAAGNDLLKNVPNTYTKLLDQGVEYILRAVVNPSSHPGFTKAADSLGLLGTTSTGASDGYPSYPTNTGLNMLNNGADFAQEETMPPGFVQVLRNFQDNWTPANVNYLKSQFDDLVAKSKPTRHLTMRLGTHTATFSGVRDLFAHADSVDADKVWFVGFQEYLEYREMKRLCKKSQQVRGNMLTITLDLGTVPADNRFRDISLLITGGAITNVSATGADRFSYNAETGLINIFKLKTTGFKAP